MSEPNLAAIDAYDATRVARHFDGLVARHGHDVRALDWGSAASQTARFDVLASGLTLAGRQVLDVGCGLGDFKGYLDARKIPVAYRGVDVSPKMAAAAKQRLPGVQIDCANVLDTDFDGACDVAVASGILYLLADNAEAVMQRIIARMFSFARQAVAFNTLSAWADRQEAGEFYADPVQVLSFCRTLTPWIRLRHDYLPHDFMVFLYKERPGA